MFKGALIFVCGVAAGALVYDGALERATVKPPQFWLRYSTPTMTDYSRAEIEHMYKGTLKARK